MFKSFVLKLERAAKKDKQPLAFSSWSILSEGNHGLVGHAFKSCINKLMCQGWYCVTEPTCQMATFWDNSAIIPEQASVDNTRHSLMLVCFGSENEKDEACLSYFFTSMQRFSTDFSGHSSCQPLLRIHPGFIHVIHMSITSFQMICTELFSADSAARCVLLCKLWWIGVSIISNISL